MKDDWLRELTTEGFGPLSFSPQPDGAVLTRALGHVVRMETADGAICISTTVGVEWPAGDADHLQAMLHELTLVRPELVVIDVSPDRSGLTVTMWIAVDARRSEVAVGAWSVATLASLAARTVAGHRQVLVAEAAARAATDEVRRGFEELEAAMSVPRYPPPPPAPGPPS